MTNFCDEMIKLTADVTSASDSTGMTLTPTLHDPDPDAVPVTANDHAHSLSQ